jgi:hypothetical protein
MNIYGLPLTTWKNFRADGLALGEALGTELGGTLGDDDRLAFRLALGDADGILEQMDWWHLEKR